MTQSPSLTGSGSNYAFTGGPITTSLAPGTYTATIRIAIEDAGHNTLAFRDASVSYTIQPLTGLAANPLSLDFIQLQGAPAPVAQNLGISELGGASYAWNASVVYQSGSGWLNINGAASASGATLPTSLSISVNPSGALGTLSAIVRVTGNGNTLDVPVRYALLEPQVSPPAVSLSFDAVRGGALPPTQGVPFSTQGNVPVNYTSTVAYNGGSGWLSTPASGTFPGTVSVSMNTSNLASGIYTAEIRLATATRTIIVYVGYTVSEPRIGRPSPDFLIFNAASSGALPPAQSVALSTDQNLTVPYTVLVSYDEGSGWLSTPAGGTAPGSLSLGVSTTDLPPGTYFAHVLLASADRVGREFIVEYSVSPSSLTLSPAAASFTIDSNSLPSALSKTVTVGATGSALSWTALSSQPWISVSPTSGLSGTPITVSLDAAQIGTFDPGTRSAPITFSYTSQSGIPTRATLPVTLNLLLPKVNYVSPYVELPNTSTEVILRGSGFSNATGLNVMFGGTPVSISNANVISDTEIRVSHPSLAAGKYLVAMQYGLAATLIQAVDDFLTGPSVLADGSATAAAEIRRIRAAYPETVMRPVSSVGSEIGGDFRDLQVVRAPNEPGHEECMIFSPDESHRLLFIEVEDAKQVRNRVHLDLRPTDRPRDEEVERVTGLGATVVQDCRTDDGRGWVVMADPEGNEFCILRSDDERRAAGDL